jgi:hypothetical protein
MSPTVTSQTLKIKRFCFSCLSAAYYPLLWHFSWHGTHPHAWNTLHTCIPIIHCVKAAYTYHVVIATRKIGFVWDNPLETNMHSAHSDMEAADHHETPGWDTLNYRQISCQFLHDSLNATAIMASSLALVRTVCGRSAFTIAAGGTITPSHRIFFRLSKHISVLMTSIKITQLLILCISTSSSIISTDGLNSCRCFRRVCVCSWAFDHHRPCCIPKTSLHRRHHQILPHTRIKCMSKTKHLRM